MILNAFALIALFIGGLSLLLMVASAVSAFHFGRRMKWIEGPDERARTKDLVHLSFLLLCTAFILRLAAWPLFYILLQSYIPLIPGAMCIFGVTQVRPGFVLFLQLWKPLSFFLIGGWLILYQLDLSLKTRPLIQTVLRFLAVVSFVAVVDAAAELAFILSFSPPGVAVSCCTAVVDLAIPAAQLNPEALFGAARVPLLLGAYYGSSLSLLALLGYLIIRKKSGSIPRAFMALTAGVAGLGVVLTYAAYRERIGPRMMELPDHHCLYCLLQYQPWSIFIISLFLLGSCLSIWPLMLHCLVPSQTMAERLSILSRSLYRGAFCCLTIALLMTWILSWCVAVGSMDSACFAHKTRPDNLHGSRRAEWVFGRSKAYEIGQRTQEYGISALRIGYGIGGAEPGDIPAFVPAGSPRFGKPDARDLAPPRRPLPPSGCMRCFRNCEAPILDTFFGGANLYGRHGRVAAVAVMNLPVIACFLRHFSFLPGHQTRAQYLRQLLLPFGIAQRDAGSHAKPRRHILSGNPMHQSDHRKLRSHVLRNLINGSHQFIGVGSAGETLVRQDIHPSVKTNADQSGYNARPQMRVRHHAK